MTRVKNTILFLLSILSTLFLLTGCLHGNGEGYGGARPSGNQTPSIVHADYYWLDPTYTCIPSGQTQSVPSYRAALKRQADGTIVLTGDRCSDSTLQVSEDQVKFAQSIGYAVYEGHIFMALSQEPPTDNDLKQTPAPQALCQTKESDKTKGTELLFSQPTLSAPLNALISEYDFSPDIPVSPFNQFNLTVTKNADANQVSYTSAELEVILPLPFQFPQTPGHFTFSYQGQSLSDDLFCWIGQESSF